MSAGHIVFLFLIFVIVVFGVFMGIAKLLDGSKDA